MLQIGDKMPAFRALDETGKEVTEKEEGIEYTEENGYKIVKNKVNPDEVRNTENYILSKNIIKEKYKDS